MGVALGLLLGIGLLLVWTAFTVPPSGRSRRPRLRQRLDAAGLETTSGATVVAASGAAALVVFVALFLVSRALPVAGAFAVMAAYAPYAWITARLRRRQDERAEVWPDAVDNVASAVRAGLSLPEALSGLAERGPEPLRGPFGQFTRDFQASGRFGASLDSLKDHLADPVGDRVVEGLRVARDVGGGDLGRLLRTMSGQLREEARTRAELVARQSWAVNGARMAVSAPWLVLLLMAFQPEVVGRYSSPGGVVVLTAGAVSCLFAYRLMLRIGRLPAPRRVLS